TVPARLASPVRCRWGPARAGFVAGEPVEACVATVAAARAADQALLAGAFQPARQGRAVRAVFLDGPALQNGLLAELVGGVGQDVMHLGPGLHEDAAGGVGPHQVVRAVGVELDDEVARRLDVAGVSADTTTTVAAAGAAIAAHLHDDVRETRQRAGAARCLAIGAIALR